ncbi:hypothetical protein ACKI1I_28400 [Streptomyces turgidiscabies]|uniref:Regulatory protein n=1 Tax=Streptomyces turgidiscabies (strain Car8) TaxID=698760 RepID=L7F1V4_STRT8|nr:MULTISPECIES: hypothetical protein [Streptomyces]ELP64961.1 hypothetical protein STRTUCAR8_00308 [Streptomyces turgidiscabies Car8]MDX3498231.1 hypothetical protein [Streptomyces turgidiscabies]GAQ75204.1 hypothetical protein T45_06985 [Streptomyces turgidiscabies]
MPDSKIPTTELTSQYMAQVANDLDRNDKEQDRISAEIDALQEQLRALQHDNTVLTNMRNALGATGTAAQPAPKSAATPAVPRQKATPQHSAGKGTRAKKTATAKGSEAARKPAAKKSETVETTETVAKSAATKATQPTLVELIRRHLADQSEPRSAAEIATSLGEAHPDRGIKTTVVRTTVEGLVAKSHAQRTKQGHSVYYTTTDAQDPTPPAAAPADDRPEAN